MRYDYQCRACKHEFTDSAKVDERNDPKPCPKCGRKARRKEVSQGVRHVLKGSCWARDKYGK